MKDVTITHGTAVATFNTEYAATLTEEQFMDHYRPSHFSGFDTQGALLAEAWEKVQAEKERDFEYMGEPILRLSGEVTSVPGGPESGPLIQPTESTTVMAAAELPSANDTTDLGEVKDLTEESGAGASATGGTNSAATGQEGATKTGRNKNR